MNEERELINGKPYLGVWIEKWVILFNSVSGPWQDDPSVQSALELLRVYPNDVQIRHEKVVYKAALRDFCLAQSATVAVKYLAWGRAFKVMRLFKKGTKKHKKIWLGGRRKVKRVF